MQFRIAFACLSVALALLASPAAAQRGGVAQTGIAKLPFADRPQRSTDQEQETLALQLVDSLALACRGTEMYRWRFVEEDPGLVEGDRAERARIRAHQRPDLFDGGWPNVGRLRRRL